MPSFRALDRPQYFNAFDRFLNIRGHVRTARFYFLAALVFYLFTLQPSLSWGDGVRLQREVITGESFILAELVDQPFAPDPFPFAKLGIAAWDHPLYVMAGHALVRAGTAVFPAVDALWWVNLVSALCGAAAIALVFKIGLRLTASAFGSGTAALLLAVSHTFWWHAATPEVYTLHAALLLAAFLFFLDFFETKQLHFLSLGVFFFGLALSNHFLAGLAVFPLLAFAALHARDLQERGVFNARTLLAAVAVFLLAFSPVLVQAFRMLRTFSFAELFGPVVGADFFEHTPSISLAESFLRYLVLLVVQFSPLGVVPGLLGLKSAWTSQAKPARLVPLLFAVYMLFGVLYRVPDQFAFHLTSYVMFALALPFGLADLVERLKPRAATAFALLIGLQIILTPTFYSVLAANLPKIGLTEQAFGVPAIGTGVRDGLAFYVNPNKRGDDQPYAFGSETLAALPKNALVLAQWYTDTDEYFIFRYFQAVEGFRPDLEIEGWTQYDAFSFEPSQAVDRVSAEAAFRPVYLASLSDEFYDAGTILENFCVFPEHNLFRVVTRENAPPDPACIRSD